jgi:hypothetical protein
MYTALTVTPRTQLCMKSSICLSTNVTVTVVPSGMPATAPARVLLPSPSSAHSVSPITAVFSCPPTTTVSRISAPNRVSVSAGWRVQDSIATIGRGSEGSATPEDTQRTNLASALRFQQRQCEQTQGVSKILKRLQGCGDAPKPKP